MNKDTPDIVIIIRDYNRCHASFLQSRSSDSQSTANSTARGAVDQVLAQLFGPPERERETQISVSVLSAEYSIEYRARRGAETLAAST